MLLAYDSSFLHFVEFLCDNGVYQLPELDGKGRFSYWSINQRKQKCVDFKNLIEQLFDWFLFVEIFHYNFDEFRKR